MIKYGGIKQTDKVYFITFLNERKEQVDVPIDELTAKRISMYLNKIAIHENKIVEHGNDEPTD